ncbi:SWI SNF complex component SNF12 homolog, putative [Babesia caballi]|uniref:SWI SNF complex component SNF12 homolog, putative n=1 Tax=Babesia caballi TaxID=5871 RepID=A0AAV4LQC9_BABCB|nr:SWI SNF complex component SNF12 homolog, putative [Babesia caballi]
MSTGKAILSDYVTQWCNGNYELIHSCLQQLLKAGKASKTDHLSEDGTARSGGFWHRFWGRAKPRHNQNSDSTTAAIQRDGCHAFKDNGSFGFDNQKTFRSFPSLSDPPDGAFTDESLEKIRSGVIGSFRKFPFHRPHLVPRRDTSMGLDHVREYIRKKFATLEKSLDQIEAFSTIANVQQHLCCELLYEGIFYYGEESQTMSESAIIESMLHVQSDCQLKCLTSLYSFINEGRAPSDASVLLDAVFPESITILREVLSKGLIKNLCLLLLSAMKEASRYKSMVSGESDSSVRALYDHTVDLVNGVLRLLEVHFLHFHPSKDDLQGLIMILPHVFDLGVLLDLKDYSGSLFSLLEGMSDGSSAWYPTSANLGSLCVGVREFDELSNCACNTGSRLSLIAMLALHPHHYRLPPAAEEGAPLKTILMADVALLDRFKSTPTPFNERSNLATVLEFIVFGMFFHDVERATKCIESGVFVHIGVNVVDATPAEQRHTVTNILELMLSLFLFSNGSLSKSWYDIMDYEVQCKRGAEDHARLVFVGTVDEVVYRPPGRSLMELMALLSRFEPQGNKRYAFQIWKSCAEAYRSVIPNVNCQVYKYNAFENQLYNSGDTAAMDAKTVSRLVVPCEGFSWWERNSALLDLVTLSAGDQNIYVETYPRLLTSLLEFGLYLSTADDIDGVSGGQIVGQFLSTGASRELRFPFLLERLVSQIGSLTKGSYEALSAFIYDKLLARDDQIETAEAALMIASTISTQNIQQNLSVGSCLRKMYTFPLISGVPEVKVALSTLGLGGRCPFGLIETSIAAFKLISYCDRIPKGVSPSETVPLYLDVNIQNAIGGGERTFLNAIFSILSRSHMEGLEMLTSAVLSSLCSRHIKDHATACAALRHISELLRDSKSVANHGYAQGRYNLSIEELRAFVNCVRSLFVYVPRAERFQHSGVDWLHRLVEFALWILDTHCLRNACVHWELISDVFEFLHEVAQGPLDARGNTSRASQYLLEQLLLPASSACVSLVRAASEAKVLAAISIACILFKRDVLLIVAHRAAMFMSTHRAGSHCPHCGLPYLKDSDAHRRLSDRDVDMCASTGPLDWWTNKIRKINNIFSSLPSRERPAVENTCECLQLDMHPISLLLVHDAVNEAMATLRFKNDRTVDMPSRCDFFGCFDSSASEELRMKSVYLLLQLQQRVGINSLVVSSKVVKELQRYYDLLRPCDEFSQHVTYPLMESEDLVLYNKVTTMVADFNRMDSSEHGYYCMSHLCDLNRCGIDNLILFFLKQCAVQACTIKSENNFAFHMLGSDRQVVALIRLASGGGDIWHFSDWRRVDALASLLSFSKVSPHVLSLVENHWGSIEDDASKIDLIGLSYDSYIMQCQRLSHILQLLVLLAENGAGCVVLDDLSHYVKLYSRFVKSVCATTSSMTVELDSLLQGAVEGKDGLGAKGFMNLWRCASFQSNVCLAFDLQLGTKLLNPRSCEQLHQDMKRYALRVNSANMVHASSIGLVSCLLNFISHCTKHNIAGLSEKTRSWLEVASAEFDPEETDELKLTFHVALIKQLGYMWISNNFNMRGNDSILSISVVLKLLTFMLTHRTSAQLRSKIYACVNVFLASPLHVNSPKIAELVVAHLLSQSSEVPMSSMTNRLALLQILLSDATDTKKDQQGKISDGDGGMHMATDGNAIANGLDHSSGTTAAAQEHNGVNCGAKGYSGSMELDLHYNSSGLRQVFVGQDYTSLDVYQAAGMSLKEIVDLERVRSNEMLFVAANGGVRLDCRVEALTLLSYVLSALHKFEASAIEYDLGTVHFGAIGSIGTASVSSLLHNRLLRFTRCKQCLLHSPYCPLCLQLLTGTVRVLKAASGLQQFSALWFHVQPTSPTACLADLFLSCDLLLGFTQCSDLPTELFYPFVSILENLLGMPSVKTRNALIQWLNRHAELLASLLSVSGGSAPSDDKVLLICGLLRIYRVCVLWLLADYRHAKFQVEPMRNFSLILADLQCKFPLAMSMPRSVLPLLELLTAHLPASSDCHWQCILLGLQTIFPELGAFEADLDFSGQTPIKVLAIEKAGTVATVLTRCCSSLLSFINHLNFLDPASKRKPLGRFALRIATVECAATLLEYILALVLTQSPGSASATNFLMPSPSEQAKELMDSGVLVEGMIAAPREPDISALSSGLAPKLKKLVDLSKVELLLDKIARLCEDNGARLDDSMGTRRKHVLGDQLVEHLAPYDLEHVASFGSAQQYTYSYKPLFALLLSSVCNLAMVLEQYYGCKFTSALLSSDNLQQ